MKWAFLLFTLLFSLYTYAQAPQSFNYQAVARDASGKVIVGQLSARFKLHEDHAAGTTRYTETHTVTTNDQGIFSLQVGRGTIVSGNMDLIDWAKHDYFLETEIKTNSDADYVSMGTTQLLSVPYALYAAESGNSLDAGNGISIQNNIINNTGDLSDENELQSLSLNGNQLSITDGNTVSLPAGTIYTEGPGIDINGNIISANDASANNEIQSLAVNGNQLSISNSNTVTLPSSTYNAGPGININGNTISANDASSTNEIQTLSLNGQQLSLSNGGGSVQLPSGSSNWTVNGTTISNTPITDNVGIGTTNSSNSKLSVTSSGNYVAGNFTALGTGPSLQAYNNNSGTGVSSSSLHGTGGSFTSQTGTAGYFNSTSGNGLIVEHGRVGIGTTNPDRLLDVENGSVKVVVPNDPNFNNSAFEAVAYNQSTCYYGEQHGTEPAAFFRGEGGFGLVLHDDSYGGKGTGLDISCIYTDWNLYTDPSKDLNFAFNNSLKSWILDWDGSYHNISDMRLKKDIKSFSHVLNGISKLQAYTYHMKDAPEDSPVSIGFMAQEVEQQFPQMVVEKDGFKTLCYDQFAVLSIQAIKEQQVQIDTLQQKVDALETIVMEMKALLAEKKN